MMYMGYFILKVEPTPCRTYMSRSVPAIIAALGASLIMGGLAMHGIANAVENISNLVRPDSDTPIWEVNVGQANLMLGGGVGLIILSAVLYWRS